MKDPEKNLRIQEIAGGFLSCPTPHTKELRGVLLKKNQVPRRRIEEKKAKDKRGGVNNVRRTRNQEGLFGGKKGIHLGRDAVGCRRLYTFLKKKAMKQGIGREGGRGYGRRKRGNIDDGEGGKKEALGTKPSCKFPSISVIRNGKVRGGMTGCIVGERGNTWP